MTNLIDSYFDRCIRATPTQTDAERARAIKAWRRGKYIPSAWERRLATRMKELNLNISHD